jgi:glycosyltransferase involved in cell wall biosynthesis
MRVAIVHDYLCSKGGSERVFEYICEAFPEADIYTLALNTKETFPYFEGRKIQTTFLQPFIRSSKSFRWLFLAGTWAMRQFDFSGYDLVVSSSTTTAKYLKAPKGKHICYCYMPTRALWHFESYFGNSLVGKCLKPFLSLLRKRDFKAAQKVDKFLTISESSKGYIRDYYARDSEVLFCPIDFGKIQFSEKKEVHYLVVSRLEHWKRVDYAIEAFNALGLPLKVIGKGSEETVLRAKAKSNITFLGEVSDADLALEYSRCKAVIFTPFLEYGLIPIEANASGTAVIAYGKGGIQETMIPDQTAVFFEEQTAASLIDAVRRFEKMQFKPYALRKHAMKWESSVFIQQFRKKVLAIRESL